ncbi:GNAT family N-acetyltransferase [Fulvivirga sp. 29W222]|uniref:GNAT family N-acetyltransferase n=1 Tax=Fulvivirga marina TaxID=2494733 RepID=A0A937KEB6_9BACT|nr:GNAT family N-acetyltransferase [Fulvivirga marina]MBL6449404.1 GNAT family N-acetyltransferase [Fulvivirga marina]
MKKEELINQNIENLISLWQTVSEKTNFQKSEEGFEYSMIPYSEWPNRLWFHQAPDEKTVAKAKEILLSSSKNITIPYWDIYANEAHQLLECNGFEVRFEQIGMSLKLTQSYDAPQNLELKKVRNGKEAQLWEKLFQQAFGYQISHKLLQQDYESTDFIIAYHNESPVGTAVLHHPSGDIIGIHAMGIIPEARRQGYAEQLMKIILNHSIEHGFKFATLQASAMGKGIYIRLGFEEQFLMKNYTLNK